MYLAHMLHFLFLPLLCIAGNCVSQATLFSWLAQQKTGQWQERGQGCLPLSCFTDLSSMTIKSTTSALSKVGPSLCAPCCAWLGLGGDCALIISHAPFTSWPKGGNSFLTLPVSGFLSLFLLAPQLSHHLSNKFPY